MGEEYITNAYVVYGGDQPQKRQSIQIRPWRDLPELAIESGG